jgi:hypothetical protein
MPVINITCQGTRYVPIEDLEPFQGNLKVLTKKESDKLKRQIVHLGFSFPVFVWKDSILDGHNRIFAVQELKSEGYTIGDIPVVDIEAKNRQEAAEKLLALNSHYARITDEGLYEFLSENCLDIKDLALDLSLPDIDMDKFLKGFGEDVGGAGNEKAGNSDSIKESFMIVVTCDSESQQLELLEKFQEEGLQCRSLIS